MAAGALTDRYAANLHGVLSCYGRIIVTGTLPGVYYAAGMTSSLSPSAMTRQLRRLRMLGLIKKVTQTYRYYLTRLGRAAIAACSLTRFNIVPAMAAVH
jgi:DNA-binding transcriptional ArsR family regulator